MTAGVRDRSADVAALLAAFGHGAIVVHLQVFAALSFEVGVYVGHHAGHLSDDEHIGAQTEHLVGHVAVDSGHECNNRDHGRYADDHAQQSQH